MNSRLSRQIVNPHQQKESKLDTEPHQVRYNDRKWHGQAWEVHLTEHSRIGSKHGGYRSEALGKITPYRVARQVENESRNTCRIKISNFAKNDIKGNGGE